MNVRQLLTGTATALFGAALGFGISQATLSNTVREVQVEVRHLKDADSDNKEIVADLKRTEAAHMKEVIDLIKEHIKINSEFIEVIRIQNGLLQRIRSPKDTVP